MSPSLAYQATSDALEQECFLRDGLFSQGHQHSADKSNMNTMPRDEKNDPICLSTATIAVLKDEDLLSEVSSLVTISLGIILDATSLDGDFTKISSFELSSAIQQPRNDLSFDRDTNAPSLEDEADRLWDEDMEDWEVLSEKDGEEERTHWSYESNLLLLSRKDMMRQGGLTYLTKDYYQNPFDQSKNGIYIYPQFIGDAKEDSRGPFFQSFPKQFLLF